MLFRVGSRVCEKVIDVFKKGNTEKMAARMVLDPLLLFSLFAKLSLPSWLTDTLSFMEIRLLKDRQLRIRKGLG